MDIRLSATIAHKLVSESALSAWASHRLLGNMKQDPTSSQIEGRMWHAAILGQAHDLVVCDFDGFKTKAAREERDHWLAEGKIPVAAPKMEELAPSSARIRDAMAAKGIHLSGVSEERFEWDEYGDDGKPVACSGYVDHYVINEKSGLPEGFEIKSGKTPTSLHEATMLICRNHAIFQDPAYRGALSETLACDREMVDMTYVFVQTREPFSVTPVRMSGAFRELAHLRWRRAINDWQRCLNRGTDRQFWPDVTEGVAVVDAPGWMLSQEIEMEAMRDE